MTNLTDEDKLIIAESVILARPHINDVIEFEIREMLWEKLKTDKLVFGNEDEENEIFMYALETYYGG